MRVLILLAVVGAAMAQSGFFQIPGINRQQRPRGRPQQQRFRRPQQQQFVRRPQQQQFRGGQSNQIRTGGAVDDQFGGHQYHYSWRHGGGDMTGGQAAAYCSRLGGGWKAISINDKGEDDFVQRVITGERLEYIWTGGNVNRGNVRWPSGGTGYANWSHTGGARRPQPDNREGNESCLAILNNFYRDGVKWHDVACSHRKPTICERG